MVPITANINTLWTSLMVEELRRSGVTYFIICPGSRSAPLTVAAARNRHITTMVVHDERGAGFHAVGYARATGRPAAVISTSGTAAANFLPAVVEASMDHVPMVVLTADRPPELRGCGANQTIDQVNLYGAYARHFVDLPCPDHRLPAAYVLTTVDQSVSRAMSSPKGPVHINCMFREPLAPVDKGEDFAGYLAPLNHWFESSEPYTKYSQTRVIPSDDDLSALTQAILQTRRGVVLLGDLPDRSEKIAAGHIAEHLGWPVLADIRSGFRLGGELGNAVAFYDLLLTSKTFTAQFRPEMILHIGGSIVSKRCYECIAACPLMHYYFVSADPIPIDPVHQVTRRLQMNVTELEQHLTSVKAGVDVAWRDRQLTASETVAHLLATFIDDKPNLNEPGVARRVVRKTPPGSVLVAASSLPIRDLDMYAPRDGAPVVCMANRGASGIDGTVATTAGVAAGAGSPVTLMTGDLALLHDLNSLAMVARSPVPVTIVVINNDGGGIFSFLPIAENADVFDKYFVTPHGMTFEHAAEQFGLNYTRVDTAAELGAALLSSGETAGGSIIEATVERDNTVALYSRLTAEIERRLAAELSS